MYVNALNTLGLALDIIGVFLLFRYGLDSALRTNIE